MTRATQSLDEISRLPPGSLEPLTWQWGEHVFTFGPLVQGLIELAVVLAVALAVRRRFPPAARQ